MTKEALILFLKYPERGMVKTRLAAVLGDALTLEFYRACLADLALMINRVATTVILAYSGPPGVAFPEFPGQPCILQRGNDLGKRMFNAFGDIFARGFERAVLIGSDSPDLPAEFICAAFLKLDSSDVVLGPSTDGGYNLIGCNAPVLSRSFFTGISWSTPTVFTDTLSRIREAGRTESVLSAWPDIDSIDDLKNFYLRNRHNQTSKVIQCLNFHNFPQKV